VRETSWSSRAPGLNPGPIAGRAWMRGDSR
jgi:hypothetical protein